MYVKFPVSLFKRIRVIWRYQGVMVLRILIYATVGYFVWDHLDNPEQFISTQPISILGIALSIFLGFRNNAAYDRWWEARKTWGGIVNYSRSWAMQVLSMLRDESGEIQKELIYRHLAWLTALRTQLRKLEDFSELKPFLNESDFTALSKMQNKATWLISKQGKQLYELVDQQRIDQYAAVQMNQSLVKFYDYQGISERIKNTPFLPYYDYFTRFFLWVFILLLPFSLFETYDIYSIPISVVIGFVFSVIEQTGRYTEDPFENKPNDIPMTALCRTIEIDLKQLLHEKEVPARLTPDQDFILM